MKILGKLYFLLSVLVIPLSGKEYYSQSGQDHYVYNTFFKGVQKGVFVDIGAHDGISFSNTKYFEELGWTGLCVEPIPEIFNKLQRNRKCICVKGCVAKRKGKQTFFRCHGHTEMLSGLKDNYHPKHLKRIKREQKKHGGYTDVIKVDCFLFNDLLEKYKITKVNYLSIDTEGNELEILQSIDYNKYKIDIIDVENNYKDIRILQFLNSKGFNRVKLIGADEVFVNKLFKI